MEAYIKQEMGRIFVVVGDVIDLKNATVIEHYSRRQAERWIKANGLTLVSSRTKKIA